MDSPQASGDHQGFSRNPRRIPRSKENSSRGYIFYLADASQRGLRLELFAEIALVEAGRDYAFCLNHAGIERVNPDVAGTEFLSQRPCNRVDRALGSCVNGSICRRERARGRADVDDAAALGTKVFRRLL